ncbi:hypothetical protein F2Q69_00014087 [Brassica cretica]|uniref:Uncharacterized protein n=1 Tax=Brassica cretica TaxID=69181 RepID=A0A8S9R5J8_BRACR|nr:hypothetical protein F2Q69_00014087 [Brassica cretica]
MICRGAGGVIAEGEKEILYAEELVELSPELMEEDSKPPHEVEEEKKRRREEVKRQLVTMLVDEKTKQR